jgi:hypothetical protein
MAGDWLAVVFIGMVGFIYFIPTIMAFGKKKKNRVAIFLLNLFLGWTFLGWIGAVIWAACED